MITCQYCNKDGIPSKSHIIPASFFRQLNPGDSTSILVSNTLGVFNKKSPIGIYDSNILCIDCEKKFADIDDFAAKILIRDHKKLFKNIPGISQHHAIWPEEVDKIKLIKFFVGVLWRASASTHDFYARVSLGPLKKTAQDFLDPFKKEIPKEFDIVLTKWREYPDEAPPYKIIMDPHKEKWSGVNCYKLYLGEFMALIKADQRPFPSKLLKYSLCGNKNTVVVIRDFYKSNDYQVMKLVSRESAENIAKHRKIHLKSAQM